MGGRLLSGRVAHGGGGRRRPAALALLWLAIAAIVLAAPPARADAGDRALGVAVGVGRPTQVGAALCGRLGLSDWFALEGQLATRLHGQEKVLRAGGALSLVWMADVLSWVPELGVGVALWPLSPLQRDIEALVSAGVRRPLGFDWSVGLRGTLGWRASGSSAVVHAAVWRHFD